MVFDRHALEMMRGKVRVEEHAHKAAFFGFNLEKK